MMKLYSAILTKAEADGDTETVQEVNQMLQEKLPAFAESADLEVQERVRSVQSHHIYTNIVLCVFVGTF